VIQAAHIFICQWLLPRWVLGLVLLQPIDLSARLLEPAVISRCSVWNPFFICKPTFGTKENVSFNTGLLTEFLFQISLEISKLRLLSSTKIFIACTGQSILSPYHLQNNRSEAAEICVARLIKIWNTLVCVTLLHPRQLCHDLRDKTGFSCDLDDTAAESSSRTWNPHHLILS